MSISLIFREITEPRFSTEEMETSRTKCFFDFEISSMYYDDERHHLPTHAFGWVLPPRSKPIRARWNKHGECLVNSVRLTAFDLVRQTQKEIDSARAICESLLAGLVVIIICIIF